MFARQVSRFLQLLQSYAKFCQAGKQFSAGTLVICKVCQAGKLFSAVTPVICVSGFFLQFTENYLLNWQIYKWQE